MGKTDNRTKGIIALVFLSAIFAGTGIISRYLGNYFTPVQQLAFRTLFAFLLGSIVFNTSLHFDKLKKITVSEWFLLFIRTAAMFLFGAVLWVKATTLTKLANVTFVDSIPITAALSFIMLREKVTTAKIFYVLLSFIGVLLLAVKNPFNLSTLGVGELLVFISGFFFAFRSISRLWHTKLLNDQEITQLMFIMGTVMLFITSFALHEPYTLSQFKPDSILMLVIGAFVLIANLFLVNYGFARVPAVLANNILNLEAAFGMLFGYLFYHEVSSFQEIIGGILIVVSVIKLNREKS